MSASQGWHEGVKNRDTERAINTLEEGKALVNKIEKRLPFTAFIRKLELEKNIVYINQYKFNDKEDFLTAEKREEGKKLINRCLQLFLNASIIFNSNPENHRLVDIIGFACNLYGQYSSYLLNSDNEGQNIFNLYKYGEKIRYRAYQAMPDDIWLLRGYAWSLHSGARLYKKIKNDTVKQKQLLKEALTHRMNYHRRLPGDVELPEDIFSNVEELLDLKDLDPSEIEEYKKLINEMYDIY